MKTLCDGCKKFLSNDENIFYVFAVAAFLPYILSFAVIGVVAIYLFGRKDFWNKVMKFKGTRFVWPYALIAVAASLFRQNFLGLAVGLGVSAALLVFQYCRTVATRKTLEKTFDLCCVLSMPAVFVAGIEFLLLRLGIIVSKLEYRCESFYHNPNFFGTTMVFVMLICAYKILSKKGFHVLYYISFIVSFVGIVFSGSMFALIELAVGLFFLILFTKRYSLLALYICAMMAVAVVVMAYPEILPRLAEVTHSLMSRWNIWKTTFAIFKDNWLIGAGNFSYGKFAAEYAEIAGVTTVYPAFYAHSLLLESLSAVGVAGTVCLCGYLWTIWKDFKKIHPRGISHNLASLPIATAIGVLVHGIVDVTVMWIQPGFLFIIILSSIGALEKMDNSMDVTE